MIEVLTGNQLRLGKKAVFNRYFASNQCEEILKTNEKHLYL